jgi:hypothetical protein
MEKGKPTYFNLFLNEETYGDLIDGVFSKMEITKEQTGKSPRPFISNRKCQIAESITIPAGTDLDITLWLNERNQKRSASISIKLAEEYQGSGGGGYRKPSSNQGKSIGDTSVFSKPPVRPITDDDDFNDVPF